MNFLLFDVLVRLWDVIGFGVGWAFWATPFRSSDSGGKSGQELTFEKKPESLNYFSDAKYYTSTALLIGQI